MLLVDCPLVVVVVPDELGDRWLPVAFKRFVSRFTFTPAEFEPALPLPEARFELAVTLAFPLTLVLLARFTAFCKRELVRLVPRSSSSLLDEGLGTTDALCRADLQFWRAGRNSR